MTGLIVVGVEISLALLLMVMAYRMLTLARQRPSMAGTMARNDLHQPTDSHAALAAAVATRDAYSRIAGHQAEAPDRMVDRLTQARIFASVQLTDTRRRGVDLPEAARPLKQLAAAYFYGATYALACGKAEDHEKVLAEAIKIIEHALDMGEISVSQSLATLTENSSALFCYRLGLEGAEHWQTHRFVPDNQSLYTALTANALI